MKSLLITASAITLLAISGCSTIVNGKVQTVSINSNVADAQITINGSPIGRTPFAGLIERSNKSVVSLSKDGYVTKTVTLDTSVEPIFFGNLIIGGVLGSTTDAASGSMYKYAPSTVQIDLEKKPN
jgi:hypothetical protein